VQHRQALRVFPVRVRELALGPDDIARHVTGSHLVQETRVRIVLDDVAGNIDIACHVTGSHLAEVTRVCSVLDDVAGNIWHRPYHVVGVLPPHEQRHDDEVLTPWCSGAS